MTNVVFAKGLRAYRPAPHMPTILKAKLVINVDEFVAFLQKNQEGGLVTIDILAAKSSGSYYAALNAWQRGGQPQPSPAEDNVVNAERTDLSHGDIDHALRD